MSMTRVLTLMVLGLCSVGAHAAPILFEIKANEFDGFGALTGNTLNVTFVYESTTPDTNPVADRGEFSGGVLDINVVRNGVPLVFGPVTSDVLRTESDGAGFDNFIVKITSGTNEISLSSEWVFGALSPANSLPDSLRNANLLLGTMTPSADLIGVAFPFANDVYFFQSSILSVSEPKLFTMLAAALFGLVLLRGRFRPTNLA